MTLMRKTEITKRCSQCPKEFAPRSSTQTVCSFRCAQKIFTLARDAKRVDQRETKRRLDELKPRSKWLAEAQAAFNGYIRMRDRHLPCISCDKPAGGSGSWDAGHYLTRGARPELRFNELNVHRQCVRCNQHLHGNVAMFRVGLVRRIGLDAVEKLERPHPPMHYSVDDLRILKHEYRVRAKQAAAIEFTQEEGTAQ